MTRAALWLLAGVVSAAEFPLNLSGPGEVVAEIRPRAGADLVALTVTVDGAARQRVWAFKGMTPSVFLGPLAAGAHRVEVDAEEVRFRQVRRGDPDYDVIANAPVLHARPGTVDRATDMPLLVYCERVEGGLDYTVIYSNEDGGTSTRALMARWGRPADIEYTYRVRPNGRATYQGKDHKELEFRGQRDGAHPVLYVVTRNNMVADRGRPTERFQLAPVLVELGAHSRERVMDQHPWTYRVAAEELRREGKLRELGRIEGEKISDPRNYLTVEMKLANRGTAVAVLVRSGDSYVSSAVGRLDYAIGRSGWVRTAIELGAPGLSEIAFACFAVPDEDGIWPELRPCRVEAVSAVFFLGDDYVPQPSLWSLAEPFDIPPGQVRVFRGAGSQPAAASQAAPR